MAILERMKRLFRADVHAILDAVEEPEAVLKQAVREMEEALDSKQASLARNERVLSALRNQETDLTQECEAAERDLQLTLEQGTEELGHKMIGRKLVCGKRLSLLRHRITTLEEACRLAAQEVDSQKAQLDSILERAKAFVQVTSEESAFSVAESVLDSREIWLRGGPAYRNIQVTDEEIELEWIRLRQAEKGGVEP